MGALQLRRRARIWRHTGRVGSPLDPGVFTSNESVGRLGGRCVRPPSRRRAIPAPRARGPHPARAEGDRAQDHRTRIATRGIEGGFSLLYINRSFDPFVEHLGIESAMEDG